MLLAGHQGTIMKKIISNQNYSLYLFFINYVCRRCFPSCHTILSFFTTGWKLSRINSLFSCSCQLLLRQILSVSKKPSAAVIFFHEKSVIVLIYQTVCDYNKGPFNPQDLNTNSPFCLAYISFLFKCWEFGVESYNISFLIIFLILITYLLNIELILSGEIASWSLLRVRG